MGLSLNIRSYFWIVNLGFILVGAYLLADTANFFVASRLEDSMTAKRISGTSGRSPDRGRVFSVGRNYRSIISRNIFETGIPEPTPVKYIPPPIPIPLPPPLPPPPVVVVPPKVPLNMTLIGTVVSAEGPSRSYAVIEDSRTRRQSIYRIGDFLLEDARLTQIYRNRVVISRGDEEEVLVSLSGKGARPPGAVPSPMSVPSPAPHMRPPGAGIRQVSEDEWIMDRAEVDRAIANLPDLLTKARVVPNFTDGKPDGFRIFAIREDSLYARIGLRDGDILKRVNNIEVGNPQNFLQVFEKLKGEENITIDLVRNNKEETFEYNIQ